MLLIDFETRSRCDLKKAGHANYCTDPSTDILCCAFMFADPADDREWLWTPAMGKLPHELYKLINDGDFLVAAHNAPFDRGIWEAVAVTCYGFPELPLSRWYCTAAQMRVNNLPAALEDAARALDATHKKDHKGKALIRRLSVPDKVTGQFVNDPEAFREMCDYCVQDVRVMKGLVNSTRLMTEKEHEDWLINEDINERGVLVDVALAQSAERYANDEYIELSEELSRASHGAITKHTQTVRAAKWVSEYMPAEHEIRKMMLKYVEGEPKLTLDKQARESIIDAYELEQIELPNDVIDVILALHEGSKSSVAKFRNMALRADPDTHRVHGAFIYGGASQTMRFSSMGLQIHNFPSRGLFKDIEDAWTLYYKMIAGLDINQDIPTMDALKRMLRHAIMPSAGKVFVIGDWSGIEARVLPWLSDSVGGDAKLDVIEQIDAALERGEEVKDLYQRTAESIGHPDNRVLGKVCELALGYEGGVNAFNVFAKINGLLLPEWEVKSHIKSWRAANLWAVQFWRDLESAAIAAVRANGQTTVKAGMIRYLFAPDLMQGTLLCILPDDTVLQYPNCRLEYDDKFKKHSLTALKASAKMKADAKEWPRETLYGGRLAGHATQGTAAALLRDLLAEVDFSVAHVHDEVVLEVPEAEATAIVPVLKEKMENPLPWADGLPLRAVPEIAERYKK